MFKKTGISKVEEGATIGLSSKSVVEETVKSSFQESADKLEELRAERNISDIPLNDAYWEHQERHTLLHHKHSIRTDAIETIKGKPLTEEEKLNVIK